MATLDLVSLTAARQANLRRLGECIDYAAGDVLFYSGHHPYGAYLIESGRVRLSGRRASGLAEAGALLGYDACAADRPHRLTAEAETAVRVWFVPRRLLPKLAGRSEAGERGH